MPVNGTIVRGTEPPGRKRLLCTESGHFEFKGLKEPSVAQAGPVFQDIRALVGIGIGEGVIAA